MNGIETNAAADTVRSNSASVGAVRAGSVSVIVAIDYTNYKGVRSIRAIQPMSMYFGSNEYHQDTQWLLEAYDIDKQDYRTFAMKDIHRWVQDQ